MNERINGREIESSVYLHNGMTTSNADKVTRHKSTQAEFRS